MRLGIVGAAALLITLGACQTTPTTTPSYACGGSKACTCGPITWSGGQAVIPTERPQQNAAGEWFCDSGAYVYNRDSYVNQ